MKCVIGIISMLFSFCATAQLEKKIFDERGFISITGKIKDYKPGNDNQFIKFQMMSLNGRVRDTSVYIKDGKFAVIFPFPAEGDIDVFYDHNATTLYARPGEELKLTIQGNSFQVSGGPSAIANLTIKFRSQIINEKFQIEPDWTNANDSIFTEQRLSRVAEEVQFIKRFITQNKVDNKVFADWAENEIIYNAGFDIIFHCFAGKRNYQFTHDKLFEYIRKIPINNPNAIRNSAYYRFLQMLAGGIMIIVNNNPVFDSAVKLNGLNRLLITLEKTDEAASGIAKELLYYDHALGFSIPMVDAQRGRFDSVITQPLLRKLMAIDRENREKSFVKFDLLKKLKEAKVDENIKRNLIALFEKKNADYVFVDFWGTWCGPCMSEMPHYPAFIDSLKNRKIQFLFLATETEESSMFEIKNKYKIDGDFIALNQNERRLLENAFGFNSYPSHFLIAPNSIVIDNSIGRIMSGKEISAYSLMKIRKFVPDK
ncbi:MAG TPA: TlpA disulfide reductase family protein [Chitinophagaceae bacterium]|nr:TlpA disulfide reductase family protein [Chitinophagaceae bacterium]